MSAWGRGGGVAVPDPPRAGTAVPAAISWRGAASWCQALSMQIADHISCLRREGDLLARAAERAGLDAPVPSCPGWRSRDLLAHLGFVHRWATSYVAAERTEATREPGEQEIAALAPADPAVRCWTFLPAPSPLAFWARRQAHETAIHRVDAQLAATAAGPGGELDPFPPGLAA